MSKKTIITTVGTSLFTNFLSKEFQEFLIEELNEDKWSDTLITDIERSYFRPTEDDKKELNKLDKIIYGVKKTNIDNQIIYELTNTQEINIDASAEIKSILKIANNELADVYLLATDTFMSEFAAEKISEVFNSRAELQITVKQVKRIEGLSIEDPEKFKEAGFGNLIKEINEIYKRDKKNVILNISGGYKALIPFLTIYAQLKDLQIAYIFEDSDKVISIDSLPINFQIEEIYSNVLFLKKEYFEILKKKNEEITNYISNNIFKDNNGSLSNAVEPSIIQNKLQKTINEINLLRNNLNPIFKIINKLKAQRLIVPSNNTIEITSLGILFRDYGNDKVSGEFGHIIENKLKQLIEDNDNYKGQFSIRQLTEIELSKEIGGYFYVSDNNFSMNSFDNAKKIQIGDIDIWIKQNEYEVTLIELKAYSESCSFLNKKNTDEDYFFKIKARLLRTFNLIEQRVEKKNNIKIHYIFLVYKILFKELEETYDLKEIEQYFKTRFTNDQELNFASFDFMILELKTSMHNFDYKKLKKFENIEFVLKKLNIN